MTDPLIDPSALYGVLYDVMYDVLHDDVSNHAPAAAMHAADAMLIYLREVLTPEALWTGDTYDFDVDELHDRIFGEDK